MSEADIENFVPNLAKMGYCWQFITLAGFHMDSLISEVFTKAYQKMGMLAFV
jgi:isocitrate lyase